MRLHLRETGAGLRLRLDPAPGATAAGEWVPRGRHLDLQLKSTTAGAVTADEILFDLPVRAYNLLRRATRDTPSLLALMILSPNRDEWLDHAEDRLSIRGGTYWLSLRGAASVANTSSVRVHIPRANQFTPEAPARIMTAVQRREDF